MRCGCDILRVLPEKNIMNCQHQPDNGHLAEAMRLGDRETVRIVSEIRQIDASIEISGRIFRAIRPSRP
jgi:hypothetical protein